MSKKSKRTKLIKPMKQLQQRPSVLLQSHAPEQIISSIEYARQQMRQGDFAGCISTCEPLLDTLSRRSAIRIDVLSLLGLAYGMLKQYQQSYDVFSEAIDIDPTQAELWYNHGMACHYMSRPAETVQDFERAVELTKNDTGEMARRFAVQLEESRLELQDAMAGHEAGITFEQYLEREHHFTQALDLVRQEKWQEAEKIFRQLSETGSSIPSYWGNLGVSLLMQFRYAEAEVALKQALVIDPDYAVARDNLRNLPIVRRSKELLGVKMLNPYRENDVKQALALYGQNEDGELATCTVIEKVGHSLTGTWRQLGKQPPRYKFFLNPYQETRFTTCPQCRGKTHLRKFSLVVNVNPRHTVILNKGCRFCAACDLLIVHQDQLEQLLANQFVMTNPEIIGNDYVVVGTVDKAEWDRSKQESLSSEQVVEHLHDFRDVVTFQRVPVRSSEV